MLLKADTERRRKNKMEDDEAREAREAFQKKCQERAEQLRGLVGALVAYEDGGSRYGYLRAVHFTGNEAAVERIMPLGCTRTEVTTVPCALVDAVDHSQGRPRKTWSDDFYDKPREPKPATVKEPKPEKPAAEPKAKSAGAQPAPGVYVCTRRGTNARLSISPEGIQDPVEGKPRGHGGRAKLPEPSGGEAQRAAEGRRAGSRRNSACS